MSENNDTTPIYDLTSFKLKQILNNNTNRKTVTLLGSFPTISETDRAIIILEKNAFAEENISNNEEDSYFSSKSKFETEFLNNIYGSFHCFPTKEINSIKTTVIYPATEKHIAKYTSHSKYMIQETPALYENITLPHLKSGQFSLDWVYNILEHKKEEDRIIYEDKDTEIGFILLPDLKWDSRTVETLYVLAITYKRDIKSLRDLNETHLPLLRNIRDRGCAAIERLFNLKRSELRIYIHYQPSFYHLHVHFNALKHEAPGIFCEKSHLLDTVINNIELVSDYYQKSTLPFILHDADKLFDKFEEELNIRKKIKNSN